MASSAATRALIVAAGLIACGASASVAWVNGFWGLLAGSLLVALWLAALSGMTAARTGRRTGPEESLPADPSSPAATIDRLLLDAAPTPMLAMDGRSVRAINRAARNLFATNDRILPTPPELLDLQAGHWSYEGRSWRVDRVLLGPGRAVMALIDVEREERAAEARVSAEMIHVLGHELLNGLAPIVSLAESGAEALARRDADPALVREILGTLARQADGLQRFTDAYRRLARLPEPMLLSTPVQQIADDLQRLFASRWPRIALIIDLEEDPGRLRVDRDQMVQALWALLQNGAESAIPARGDAARVELAMRRSRTDMMIDVRDNGPGIMPQDASRVFRPFHTTKPNGTGIGLSIARQIANAHGGTLTLEPEGQATFRLALPLR